MVVVLILLLLAIGVFSFMAIQFEQKKTVNTRKYNDFINQKKKSITEIKKQAEVTRSQRLETDKIREEAKFLEDEKNYEYAVLAYLKEIELAKKFNYDFHHYKESVHRVIILYGKMNDYPALQMYLETLIIEYPERNEIKNWKERLEKAELKNARNA